MMSRFAITALALFVTTTALFAADEPAFRLGAITGDDVYVRSGAGDSYYPFGKVHRGDVIKIIGEKFDWSRVVIVGPAFDKFFGFVTVAKTDSRRLELDADGKQAHALETLDVFAPNLNSKHNPDHSWKPIGKLKSGATFRVLERIETDRALVYKVALPVNAEGWIASSLIEDATPAQMQAWKNAVAKTSPEVLAAANTKTPVTTPAAAKPPVIGTPPVTPGPAPATTRSPAATAAKPVTTPVTTPAPPVPAPLAREEVTIKIPNTAPVFEVDAITGAEPAAGEADWIEPQLVTPSRIVATPVTPTPTATQTEPTVAPAPARAEPAPVAQGAQGAQGGSMISTYYDEMEDARLRAAEQMSGNAVIPTWSEPAPIATVETTATEPIDQAPRVVSTPTADPMPAKSPRPRRLSFADAQRSLQDLEDAYRRLKDEPIASAEVGPLRGLFEDLERDAADHESIAMYAAARAEQLSIWADLQTRRRELNQLREQVSSTTRDAQTRIEAAMTSGAYIAVGRLKRSIIFDGARMPVLYRIEDPRSRRTLGYLQPDARLGLEAYVDQVIGVVGRQAKDAKLRVNLFTPTRIDLMGDLKAAG